MEGAKRLISDLLVSIDVYQCEFGVLVRYLDVTPRIGGTKVQLDGRLRCHTTYSHTTIRCYVAGLGSTCATGVSLSDFSFQLEGLVAAYESRTLLALLPGKDEDEGFTLQIFLRTFFHSWRAN
ncbi:hypothetical protein Tco_1401813 [Tanacetum coccineum]